MQNSRYAVVIPAHNEAATIRQVVLDVMQYVQQIIVVDDGSTDDMAKCIEDLPIILIQHSQNRGKSASLMTGFEKAISLHVDGVFTMDADLQHEAREIPKFISDANRRGIVIGARILGKETRPKKSVAGNVIADFFIAWATKQIITDTQSGFRLYATSFLKRLNFKKTFNSCFILETYLLVKATNYKFPISTVPIHAIYPEEIRKSHYRPWKHTLPIVFMLTWYIIRHGFIITGLVKSVKYNYKLYRKYKNKNDN